MEVIRPSKFATKDFLTSMPNIVITNILDRLALQDAVRTSILSKNWRFKWTMLSQLVFDKKFFKCLLKTEGRHNYGRIISILLLHLRGAITKFALYIDHSMSKSDVEDINHWMLFLSTKGIKDLTIWKMHGEPLKLPTHLFSCLELKHLKLSYCVFDPPTSFHGFPNLLSLELGMVKFNRSKFGNFFTRCPLLEVLNVHFIDTSSWSIKQFIELFLLEDVKLVEIAILSNLKILSLSLSNLDNMEIISSNRIVELLGFLPGLQELDLNFVKCKFIEDAVKKRPPASFPCLKGLKLTRIDLADGIKLSCAFELIRCFPNLQTLEITACDTYNPRPAIPEEVDYNTMKLLQLRIVVFKSLKGSDNEVCLIKYLLACSPLLKKIVIVLDASLECEKLFARKLLKLHRASPVAEINLN